MSTELRSLFLHVSPGPASRLSLPNRGISTELWHYSGLLKFKSTILYQYYWVLHTSDMGGYDTESGPLDHAA